MWPCWGVSALGADADSAELDLIFMCRAASCVVPPAPMLVGVGIDRDCVLLGHVFTMDDLEGGIDVQTVGIEHQVGARG